MLRKFKVEETKDLGKADFLREREQYILLQFSSWWSTLEC